MKTYLPTSTNQVRCEEGAVLVVALILLLVLTMLGISAMESTKLETKMAANTTNYNRAFQTAEAGLAQALGDYTAYTSTSATAFDNITLDGSCETDASALHLTDEHGNQISQAIRCVKKSGTQLTVTGQSTVRLYYIVQSTGRSQVSENNSLETKIVSAVGVNGPNDYVLHQNF